MLIHFILVKSILVNDKYINYFLSPKMLTNVIRPQTHCLFIFVISFEWFHFTLVCSLFGVHVQAHRGRVVLAMCVCVLLILFNQTQLSRVHTIPSTWVGNLKITYRDFQDDMHALYCQRLLDFVQKPNKTDQSIDRFNDTRFRNVFEHRRAQQHRHRHCNPWQPKVN